MEALLKLAFDNEKFITFPASIENFHTQICFIIETFWKSHGNPVIILPMKSLAIENLKATLQSGGDANIAYNNYFNELVEYASFATLVPPPGLLLPCIYNNLYYTPAFGYDFNSFKLVSFASHFINWLGSCWTEEMWHIYVGVALAPTPYYGITSL